LREKLIFLTLLVLLSGLFAADALACKDVTVRDAAFTESRDVHRLCLLAAADDPAGEELYNRLDGWFGTSGTSLNVELVRVDADSPDVAWEEYGIPSAPPSLPVAVLAGSRYADRRRFFIDYWEPGPNLDDLESMSTSPARDAMRTELVSRVAVLLYIPGTNGDVGSAEPVLDAVVKRWSSEVPLGLSVVRVDRSDDRERLLLSFTGVKEQGPDWVAVVFGRGKLMPFLEGSGVTEARLNEFIASVVEGCTCLRPPSSLGVDIPMTWDESDDSAVVRLRASGDGADTGWGNSSTADLAGSSIVRRIMPAAMWTFAALAVAVTIGTGTIIWIRNRADSRPFRAD
jgi:hypothetical protein